MKVTKELAEKIADVLAAKYCEKMNCFDMLQFIEDISKPLRITAYARLVEKNIKNKE